MRSYGGGKSCKKSNLCGFFFFFILFSNLFIEEGEGIGEHFSSLFSGIKIKKLLFLWLCFPQLFFWWQKSVWYGSECLFCCLLCRHCVSCFNFETTESFGSRLLPQFTSGPLTSKNCHIFTTKEKTFLPSTMSIILDYSLTILSHRPLLYDFLLHINLVG